MVRIFGLDVAPSSGCFCDRVGATRTDVGGAPVEVVLSAKCGGVVVVDEDSPELIEEVTRSGVGRGG